MTHENTTANPNPCRSGERRHPMSALPHLLAVRPETLAVMDHRALSRHALHAHAGDHDVDEVLRHLDVMNATEDEQYVAGLCAGTEVAYITTCEVDAEPRDQRCLHAARLEELAGYEPHDMLKRFFEDGYRRWLCPGVGHDAEAPKPYVDGWKEGLLRRARQLKEFTREELQEHVNNHVRGETWELLDGRGYYCARVCDECEEQRRKEFRAEVFEAMYEADDVGDDCDASI